MNYLNKLQKNLNNDSEQTKNNLIMEKKQYELDNSEKIETHKIWLNQKVNDNYTNIIPISKNYTIDNFKKYYAKDSYETKKYESLKLYLLNSKYLIKNDMLLKDYIERYRKNKKGSELTVFIPPNTNHYYANYLFKKLVDIVDQFNMYYEVEENKEIITKPLIDINLKEEFYKFCFENSY
ncbi:MAG: hypothetical protein CMF62_03010 [Magnetococcales bacterium]|nr:hypothetical protein [Magnetococcales bacterium]|tara:strand:+ start:16066 stop:16605 length:540 start_codon:yes stop_codon:yes gene_type:complete